MEELGIKKVVIFVLVEEGSQISIQDRFSRASDKSCLQRSILKLSICICCSVYSYFFGFSRFFWMYLLSLYYLRQILLVVKLDKIVRTGDSKNFIDSKLFPEFDIFCDCTPVVFELDYLIVFTGTLLSFRRKSKRKGSHIAKIFC